MIGTIITAGRLSYAAVSGADEFIEALARFGVKLALRSHQVDRDVGTEMVELMRARAPVDSGRLVNGITSEEDAGGITIEASAVRGTFDYARSIEFGHKVGHRRVADDSFFAGGHRRSRAQHGGRADPEPFFVDSAEEVLEQRGTTMDEAIAKAAGDADL